jgi:radical SAM protein with 4Fe4S-binding SPASM domain
MRVHPASYLDRKIFLKNSHSPLIGQLELTYRCQFDCVHCYCQGCADRKEELTATAWKKILAQIQKAGCLWLGFTGGDPLIRPDFLEIYSYAKEKGFLVTILTNGYGLTKDIINYLVKSPPYSLEITVNGLTRKTFEGITRKEASWARVMANIKELKKSKLLFYIKSNCLSLNCHEVAKIKQWVDRLLGKVKRQRYYFSYDHDISPRLNGDLSPCEYRVQPERISQIVSQDQDLRQEYKDYLNCEFPPVPKGKQFLYQCSSWKNQFFVGPYGRLKFCQFSDKFSVDLKNVPFSKGFYEIFPRISREKFKTDSKCKTCSSRMICNWCPAKAYLETGNEESPVPYYCAQTEHTLKHDKSIKR